MASTEPNGFAPRPGEGGHTTAGSRSAGKAETHRRDLEGKEIERNNPEVGEAEKLQRDGPAASKGGAVRISSVKEEALSDREVHPAAIGRSDATPPPARESDRRVEWVRSAVARYERPLTQYALHLLGGDLERSRDLVQEAFLRLCDQDEGAVGGHLVEWLYTVCRNLAIDLKRKERRMRLITDEQQDTFAATYESPTDAAERVDVYNRVTEVMQSLPPRQQEIVRLKFQHGMSYKEIAEVMNLTSTNVGFILHTAIKTLREGMGSDPQRTGSDV